MFAYLVSSATKMHSYDDAINNVVSLKQKKNKTRNKKETSSLQSQ